MDIKPWQWWIKQTMTNRLILSLAIAAVALSGMVFNAAKDREKLIDRQGRQIIELNQQIVRCEQRASTSQKEIYEKQLQDETNRGRILDSLYYAIVAAKIAIKKADQHQ